MAWRRWTAPTARYGPSGLWADVLDRWHRSIEVNPFSIAGKGLTGNEADNSCLLDVQVGCGLKFDGDEAIEVDPAAIAGSGLTAGDGCTLDVMVGCGLLLNADGEVAIDRPALMGPGLKVGGEGDCDLGIDCEWIKYHCDLLNLVEGCGITITSTGSPGPSRSTAPPWLGRGCSWAITVRSMSRSAAGYSSTATKRSRSITSTWPGTG